MSTVGERAGGAAVIVSELSFFRLQPPLRDEFERSMPIPWNMAGRQIMHAYGSLRDSTCQLNVTLALTDKKRLTPPGTHLPSISSPPPGTQRGKAEGVGGDMRIVSSMQAFK